MRSALLVLAVGLSVAACDAGDPSAENTMGTTEAPPELNAQDDAPKIYCDVIGERVTQEECEDVRALRQDVRAGAAALDVPDPMTRGQNAQVTLVIDRRPLANIRAIDAADDDPVGENASVAMEDDPFANMAAETNVMRPRPGPPEPDDDAMNVTGMDDEPMPTPEQAVEQLPGQDYGFRSSVGRYMRASLAGQGFRIRLISPENPVQEIAAGGQGTWIWEVTPLEGGKRSLTVHTEAVAKINGRTVALGNSQTSKAVTVNVRAIDTAKNFLTELPVWLKLITAVLVAAAALAAAWWKLRSSMGNAKSGTGGND